MIFDTALIASDYFLTNLGANHSVLNPCNIEVSVTMPDISRIWCTTQPETMVIASSDSTV